MVRIPNYLTGKPRTIAVRLLADWQEASRKKFEQAKKEGGCCKDLTAWKKVVEAEEKAEKMYKKYVETAPRNVVSAPPPGWTKAAEKAKSKTKVKRK